MTEEVCHAPAGCWVNVETGECPDCVIGRREVTHTHEEKPVIVEKPFVEPKRISWAPKKRSKKTCDISSVTNITANMIKKEKVCNRLKAKAWLKKKIVKKEGNWTCVVGPCDFIDENGNLIEKS